MAFCTKCGKELIEGFKFCTNCGAVVAPSPSGEAATEPEATQTAPETTEAESPEVTLSAPEAPELEAPETAQTEVLEAVKAEPEATSDVSTPTSNEANDAFANDSYLPDEALEPSGIVDFDEPLDAAETSHLEPVGNPRIDAEETVAFDGETQVLPVSEGAFVPAAAAIARFAAPQATAKFATVQDAANYTVPQVNQAYAPQSQAPQTYSSQGQATLDQEATKGAKTKRTLTIVALVAALLVLSAAVGVGVAMVNQNLQQDEGARQAAENEAQQKADDASKDASDKQSDAQKSAEDAEKKAKESADDASKKAQEEADAAAKKAEEEQAAADKAAADKAAAEEKAAQSALTTQQQTAENFAKTYWTNVTENGSSFNSIGDWKSRVCEFIDPSCNLYSEMQNGTGAGFLDAEDICVSATTTDNVSGQTTMTVNVAGNRQNPTAGWGSVTTHTYTMVVTFNSAGQVNGFTSYYYDASSGQTYSQSH